MTTPYSTCLLFFLTLLSLINSLSRIYLPTKALSLIHSSLVIVCRRSLVMKFQIPKFIIDYFSSECLKSFNEDGMIETLALGLGRIVNDQVQVEELIFPAQKGKSDSVEDKGKIKMIYMITFKFL